MWLVDLLLKTVPHLDAAEARGTVLSAAKVRAIRIGVRKHARIAPAAIVRRSDEALLDAICELRLQLVGLDRAGPPFDPTECAEVVATAGAEIDRLLDTDLQFGATGNLEQALAALQDIAAKRERAVLRRKRRLRLLTTGLAVVPLLAFGTHWVIGNLYRQALLDEVDIVHPPEVFVYEDQRYRMSTPAALSARTAFRDYYFRDTLGDGPERNPLPLALNDSEASELQAELPASVREALEMGRWAPRSFKPNLFTARFFIRNIRDRNIVNRLKARVERVAERDFPWQDLDLDTRIEFPWAGVGPMTGFHLRARTTRTPVRDLHVALQLQYDAPAAAGPRADGDIERLQARTHVPADFGVPLVSSKFGELFVVLVPAERATSLGLAPALEFAAPGPASHPEESWELLSRVRSGDFPYAYAGCADGDVALIAHGPQLLALLGGRKVEAVDIEFAYEHLDGTKHSGHQRLALDPPLVQLEAPASTGAEAVFACENIPLDMLMAPTAAGGDGAWLGVIDKAAVLLAGDASPPLIVARETLLLDLQGNSRSAEKTVNRIHVFQDGDYALLTVLMVNFPGGDYRLSFYFDDEEVGSARVELEWPCLTHFDFDDLPPAFRQDGDRAAGDEPGACEQPVEAHR